MSDQLTHDEIHAALAVARGFGWAAPDDRPVSSLQMEQVLRAAYEQVQSQPSRVRGLREELAGLGTLIELRRSQLAQVDAEVETAQAEVVQLRFEKADVLAPERLLRHVAKLVEGLSAAGWPIATDAYTELRRLLPDHYQEGDDEHD